MLLRIVIYLITLTEQVCDLVLHLFTTMSHVQKLESFFNRYGALEIFIIHQELYEVIELPWLEANLISYHPLVHCQVLVLRYVAIQVIVDLPDYKSYLGFQGSEPQEIEYLKNVTWANFFLLLLWLVLNLMDKPFKHAIKTLLLDRRDYNML